MLIFIHHKNSNKDFRKILTQPINADGTKYLLYMTQLNSYLANTYLAFRQYLK